MNVNDVYILMRYIINKNQGAYLSPDKFKSTINAAQYGYQSFLIGQVEQYQYGRPVSRIGLGQSSAIMERLSPFLVSPVSLTPDGSGIAPYPSDYIYMNAMYWGVDMQRVKCIQQDRLSNHLNSVINPIATNPVFLLVDTGFQLYPITLTTAKLAYIKQPPEIVWAFIPDGNNRPVYDPGNSVDPLWSDLDIMEVIVRALAMVGVNIQAPMVQQYAQNIKMGGQ